MRVYGYAADSRLQGVHVLEEGELRVGIGIEQIVEIGLELRAADGDLGIGVGVVEYRAALRGALLEHELAAV